MPNLQVDKLTSESEHKLRVSWMKIQTDLILTVGELAFKSWLSRLSIAKIENKILYLSLPSAFLSDF